MAYTALLLFITSTIASGEPAWVTRGSGAFPSDKKAFYGVGIASGVKNPALLRSTADNRARDELGKVFETYSASLMKDYMNSSGDQNVEQAIKTFRAGTMQGAEIVDRYLNAEGVQYSLCKLDLERAKELIAVANASGAIKSYAKGHADKAYDDLNGMMKKPAAEVSKPPPPTAGGKTNTEPGVQAKSDGAKTRSGGRPAWIDGEDPSYPWSQYVYAVGFGRDRTSGENGAVAGLAKIFEVRVAQTAKDFQGAYSKSGAKNLELQSSEVLTETSTNKVLSGVRIAEVWEDKGVSSIYAIALIERSKVAASLRDKIRELDTKAKNALEKAGDNDKVKQVRSLNQALSSIQEREVLNTDLRVVDTSGVGVPAEVSYADVYNKLEGAQEALNIGVTVSGTQSDDVRAALTQGLTEMGYHVKEVKASDDDDDDEDSSGGGGDFDLLIVGKVRIEKVGQTGGFEMVRAVADFQLKNVKKNKIVDESTVSQKEGHKTVQEAQRRAIRELNKVVAPQIGEKFQRYLKR